MIRQRLCLLLSLLVIVGVLIVGCAPAAPDTSDDGAEEAEIAELQAQLEAAQESGADAQAVEELQAQLAEAEAAAEAYEAPEAEEFEEATEAPAEYDAEAPERAAEGEVGADGALVAALPQERMIIKNGEIALLVENVDVAINRVTQVATDSEGYVLSSESWFSDEFKNATVTIAVRSDRFETAMERLRDLSMQVLAETSSGQDVTGEFVDLESRLRNLEATRDRIQGFLDQAKTVDEALEINAKLSEIDDQIEQVKGRMNYLSGRSAFSTITVQLTVPQPTPTPTFTPTATSTPTATPTRTPTPTPTQWSPALTLNQAGQTQTRLFQGIVEALIWLVIVPGPYLLVAGMAFVGFQTWTRRNGNGIRSGTIRSGSTSASTPPSAAPTGESDDESPTP